MTKESQFEYECDSLSEILEYVKHLPRSIRTLEVSKKDLPHFSECEVSFDSPKSKTRAQIVLEVETELDFESDGQIVVLDHVTDPRNLGAIVRSCAFFGIRQVIAPIHRQVLLTEASVRSSAGGFARVGLVGVTNLSQTIGKLKENGFWVCAADMDGDDVTRVRKDYEKLALVFGAEGKGVSPTVKKNSDFCVSIAGGGLDSLNVSVAAGILLHSFSFLK